MAKRTNMMYPLGVTITESGAEILVQAEAEKVSLLLFEAGEKECFEQFEFAKEERIGDVWTMSLPGYDLKGLEYGFEADGEWFVDPCAKAVTGRKVWGSISEEPVRARVTDHSFNWDTDKRPCIPYSDTIVYRFHVRGLTKHPSSHVRNKGTYAGIVEMIP
ncbi:MAG: alpha-amylase, partial [Lachnospiraceae bacterium]|nr:alpha-amylase [Lachnospiraceae bacterium]